MTEGYSQEIAEGLLRKPRHGLMQAPPNRQVREVGDAETFLTMAANQGNYDFKFDLQAIGQISHESKFPKEDNPRAESCARSKPESYRIVGARITKWDRVALT